SCQFVIKVSDLCTGGNCGPAGSQGSKPDGADRGGATTGKLNATAPTQPKRAPSIVRVSVPNQNGAPVTGAQSWDPQKFVVVAPGSNNLIPIEAYDQFEAGPVTISALCNVGTSTLVSTATLADPKAAKVTFQWTAPASLVSDMNCAYTATSGA